MNDNYLIIGKSMFSIELNKQLNQAGKKVKIIERILPNTSEVLTEGITHLIVTPQCNSVSDSLSYDLYFTNVELYRRMLFEARDKNINNVTLFSSGSIYGKAHRLPIRETVQIDYLNLDKYALSKIAMETIAISMKNDFERLVILRPFMMYGKNIKSPRLLARLPEILAEKQRIKLASNIGMIINPIHVSDAAKIVINTMKYSGFDVLNLCGNQDLSLKNIVEILSNKMKLKPNIKVTDEDYIFLCGSLEKISKYIDMPLMKFEDGVIDLLKR